MNPNRDQKGRFARKGSNAVSTSPERKSFFTRAVEKVDKVHHVVTSTIIGVGLAAHVARRLTHHISKQHEASTGQPFRRGYPHRG